MKRFTQIAGLAVFIALILYMGRDMFFSMNEKTPENKYEYDIDQFREPPDGIKQYTELSPIGIKNNDLLSLAIDNNNNLIVGCKEIIYFFSADNQLLNSISYSGTPNSIFARNNNLIYIAGKNNVTIIDSTKTIIKEFIIDKGPEVYLTSIAAADSNIFIADAGNRLVYRYNHNGKFLNSIGSKDTEKGIKGFVIPSPNFDLALDPDKNLWVVNPGYHLIENYTYNGDLRTFWGKTSMGYDGFSGCCNPIHIAILTNGNFVTAEKGIERIKVHNSSGELLALVAGPAQFNKGTKGFDLAVGANERVYVLDPERKEVRIFEISNI